MLRFQVPLICTEGFVNMSRGLAVLSLAVMISSAGCAHGPPKEIECPAPSVSVSAELDEMYLRGDWFRYSGLISWIGEMERHCSAL